MSRISRLLPLVALVFLLALPALALARPSAHGGRDPGRFVSHLLDEIDADEETRTAVQAIVDGSRAEGERLRDLVKTARASLHELMRTESPDRDAVFAQAEALGRVETEARIHRLDVMLQVQEQLSPEQRAQLRDMRHARHARILESCGEDLAALCPDADPERSRDSVRCLMRNRAQLSESCQDALPSWGGKRGGPKGECAAKHAKGECGCSCGASGSCGRGAKAAPPAADTPDEAAAEPETTPAD